MRKLSLMMVIFMVVIVLSSCDEVIIPNVPVTPNDESFDLLDPLNDPNYDRLFETDGSKSIIIDISGSEYDTLDDIMKAHHEAFGDYRSSTYVKANITYEDSQGMLTLNQVGFRTRGNLSRNRIQDDEGQINVNHYKLKFDETFNDTLDVSKRYLFGLEELDLKYNRNADPTYMNEHYALSLYREFEVFAQKTTHVMIYLRIDGYTHKMGLYTAFEPIDETFIERRFEGERAEGDLYKALWQQFGPALLTYPDDLNAIGIKDTFINYRPAYDLKTNKDTSMHESLLSLMNMMKEPLHVRQAFLELHTNIDYMARFFAVSHVLGNPDDLRSNGNNYYIYIEPVDDIIYLIPYDLDHSLGQGWDGAPAFTDQLVDTPIYDYPRFMDFVLPEPAESVFVDTLFSMPSFKASYEDVLGSIVTSSVFSFDYVQKMIDDLIDYYGDMIEGSWIDAAIGYRDIEDFLIGKKESILRQLT